MIEQINKMEGRMKSMGEENQKMRERIHLLELKSEKE